MLEINMTLDDARERLRRFRDARDWAKFHNPKDLAAAIAIEAGELQELFLWVSPERSSDVLSERRSAVQEELADILIQCLNFAEVAGIDVLDAVENKIDANEEKYPVDKAR